MNELICCFYVYFIFKRKSRLDRRLKIGGFNYFFLYYKSFFNVCISSKTIVLVNSHKMFHDI